MERLRVSMITICYNAEKTIAKTIESVLSQDYENLEYIIVDGGSQDHTVDIIKSYDNKKYIGFLKMIMEFLMHLIKE